MDVTVYCGSCQSKNCGEACDVPGKSSKARWCFQPSGWRLNCAQKGHNAMSLDNDNTRTDGQALEQDAALRLDEAIQDIAGKTAEHLEYLADLLVEAKQGQIHELLGFTSWPEYLIARLRPIAVALNVEDSRTLVAQLYRHGMSVRAVAEAVGMSKSSVGRQVSQCGTGAEPCNGEGESSGEQQTTGRDGKSYRRNGGGGPRGPLPADMALKRYKSAIHNLAGLPEEAESLKDRICEEIGELISLVNGQLVNLDG